MLAREYPKINQIRYAPENDQNNALRITECFAMDVDVYRYLLSTIEIIHNRFNGPMREPRLL